MSQYENRLSCGQSVLQGDACDPRKITNLTLIKDEILVMYDDCSYTKAPSSIIDIEGFVNEALEGQKQAATEQIIITDAFDSEVLNTKVQGVY